MILQTFIHESKWHKYQRQTWVVERTFRARFPTVHTNFKTHILCDINVICRQYTAFQHNQALLALWKGAHISKNHYHQVLYSSTQCRPFGGASGALARGADFKGAPKRQSPTGHTLIRSTVERWFPHLQMKRVAKEIFLKFGCIGFSLFWCVLVFTYVYSRYALCLLLPKTLRRTMYPPLVQ
jgi:hypothetical protein